MLALAFVLGGSIGLGTVLFAVAMGRGGDRFGDLAARAEAAINQAAFDQPFEQARIFLHVRGLAAHWLFPFETQPRQVLVDRRFVFLPRAALVDVLDPEQEAPVRGAGGVEGGQRRERVAEMQIACGRRGEARHKTHGRGRLPLARASR